MGIDISNFSIGELAKQAITKPEDFGYWGFDDMFNTWGFTGIDQNGSSDILDQSNFHVISNKLMELYPNDFRIENYKHWACGYVDRLVCRILNVPNNFDEENITNAFKAAMEWHMKLDQNPIADESHYLDMESEYILDSVQELPGYLINMIDTQNNNWAENIYYELMNNMGIDITSDCMFTDDDIKTAVYQIQIWNEDAIEEWNEWTDRNGLERIPVRKENPNQLKLFED